MSGKYKEITGWSYNKNIDDFEAQRDALRIFVRTSDNFSEINASMVTAKIEIPERKIELTESMFDEVVRNHPMKAFGYNEKTNYDYKTWYKELKQKLFGSEGEG